jgi:hypothetical protein
LVAEFAARGLAATWVATADSHLGVRTAYARSLAPIGAAWLRGAVKRPPAGFHLDGPRLRLWVAAAGTPGPLGFQLRLGSDEECWDPIGAALAAIGLPAVLVTPRAARTPPTGDPEASGQPEAPSQPEASSPPTAEAPEQEVPQAGLAGSTQDSSTPAPILGAAYRITGRRRLARLAELVGERPAAAPVNAWPGD